MSKWVPKLRNGPSTPRIRRERKILIYSPMDIRWGHEAQASPKLQASVTRRRSAIMHRLDDFYGRGGLEEVLYPPELWLFS